MRDSLLLLTAILVFAGLLFAVPLYKYGLPTSPLKLRLFAAYLFEVTALLFGAALVGWATLSAKERLHLSATAEWIAFGVIYVLLAFAVRSVRTSIQGWVVNAAGDSSK